MIPLFPIYKDVWEVKRPNEMINVYNLDTDQAKKGLFVLCNLANVGWEPYCRLDCPKHLYFSTHMKENKRQLQTAYGCWW